MINKQKKYISLVFSVLLVLGIQRLHAHGNPRDLQFRYLTPMDGLSSSSINSILQDNVGYLWVATYNGLNRYDGYTFKVYIDTEPDIRNYPGYRQKALFEDSDNNLFVGSNIGLSLYDRDKDNFINFINEESSPFYGESYDIFNMDEDSIGNLWLATNRGLIYYDRLNNTLVEYTNDPDNPKSLSNNWVETVFVDSKNRIWVGTQSGLNLLDPLTKSFERIYLENSKKYSHDVSFLSMDEDTLGNIWIGSSNGLYCVENNSSLNEPTLKRYFYFPEDELNFKGKRILSVFVDNENNIWVGAENGGLYLVDINKMCFSHFEMNELNQTSLNNESIQCIYEDETGNLWIGTFGGGLNIIEKNNDAIFHYKNLKGNKSSLSNNRVSSFLQGINDNIWIGTDGGGLNLFNLKTKKFTHYNMENSGLSSNSILDLAKDNYDDIWISTWGGGVMKYDHDNKSFQSFTMQNSEIIDNNIFSLAIGYNNDIWLGSCTNGLINYQIDNGEFTNYTVANSSITSNYIFVVKVGDGQVFMGTEVGLQVFLPNENKFEMFTHDPDDNSSISHNSIYDILVENDTSVWIATQFGLNCYNPKTKSFEKFFMGDGLPDNVIRSLLIDSTGVLWVGTNGGVCRFDHINGEIDVFTQYHGLQSNELNYNSALALSNGNLLFGGTNGFNLIIPDRIIDNSSIPKIVITDFFLYNQPANANVEGSPLKEDISVSKEITLSHNENFITFYFSAMDFTRPERNKFSYMLENFDNDWIYSGTKREATYTNIDPGTYVLHVIGSNNDDVWNNTGVDLKITINPPWYLTWYFKVFYFIAFWAIIIAIFYIRTSNLRKQKEKLAKKVAERTKDLKAKNLLLEKNSEELSKTNSLLKSRQEIIEKQAESLSIQAEELKVVAENLEETNAELVNINATKDKFFSIIAHDLRSPFNSFLGFTQIMAEDMQALTKEKTQEIAISMRDSAVNLFRLLENLLQWASIQQGLFSFEQKIHNLSTIVNETAKITNETANNKGIDLSIDIPNDILVNADKNVVQMVLRNLLSNAVKFTEKGGKVEVAAKSVNDEFIEVSVKDSGIGMDKELLDNLFKLDVKTNRQGTDKEPSAGLGLIICKDLIDGQGGKLRVESQEGVGSVFYFTLRIAK